MPDETELAEREIQIAHLENAGEVLRDYVKVMASRVNATVIASGQVINATPETIVASKTVHAIFVKRLVGYPTSTVNHRALRACEIFAFFLTRRTHERVFEPGFEYLKEQYILSRADRFQGRWAKRCISLALLFQAVCLFLSCWRGTIVAASLAVLSAFVPEQVRAGIKDCFLRVWLGR
jgi:hypothetical protein